MERLESDERMLFLVYIAMVDKNKSILNKIYIDTDRIKGRKIDI